jgi:hypothetical protein
VENSVASGTRLGHLANKGCTPQPRGEAAGLVESKCRRVAFIACEYEWTAVIVLQKKDRVIEQHSAESKTANSRDEAEIHEFHAA